MTIERAMGTAALGTMLGAIMLSGCAVPMETESKVVGDSAAGEACLAERSYVDRIVTDVSDRSYVITCRSVSASRIQGQIRLLRSGAASVRMVEAGLHCGPAQPITSLGLGRADARHCVDSSIGSDTLSLRTVHNGVTVIASGLPSVAEPMMRAFRWVVGGKADIPAGPVIDFASLVAPAEQPGLAPSASDFDSSLALQQGVTLNHRGMHLEASRLLNDALSRLSASVRPAVRAELFLEAGLADSNINFSQAAQDHFERADALIEHGVGDSYSALIRKRDIYAAMNLLNRRQFRPALVLLDRSLSASVTSQPLNDIAVLRRLNQRPGHASDLSDAVAVPDKGVFDQLVLESEVNWARSIALMSLGETDKAEQALAAATVSYRPLSAEHIQQGPVLWLKARLDRQRGRIAASKHNWAAALTEFDSAVDALTLGSVGSGGTGREPAIAELKLERAGIIADRHSPPPQVRATYSEAIDAMIGSGKGAGEGVVPRGVERYLDLLVSDAAAGLGGDTDERYFRALQALGEPAVARQISRIQKVVTADPQLAAKVRARNDLEREITKLRYQLADASNARPPSPAAQLAELDKQRLNNENRLSAIDVELKGNSRLGSAEDRPVTVAEVRAALHPGEIYFKLSELGDGVYGMIIARDTTQVYRSEAPAAALRALAVRVRASVDGQIDQGRLVPFDVPASYTLFHLIAGPAEQRILKANAIVIDPSGPLERLPAGVLVTDRASVDWYDTRKAKDPWDFSGVSFLAVKSSISTSASPHSFLIARSLPPSRAPMPFIGFAEHVVPPRGVQMAKPINVGTVCSVDFNVLRDLAARLHPIERQEVVLAANSLGAPGSPVVAGAAFTDTAVIERTDLDQYQILHFATHGLEEGVWGCSKSPPALVTSFGGPGSDGLLSFDEIAGLHLNANLVVLSACDTGSGIRSELLARRSGQEESGSTLQGLVRAFLTANTRAVMATHWQVPAKEGTSEFIRTFYTSARTLDIGGSLKEAQRRLIAQPQYSHPLYWGAYFVVGDSSKYMVSK